MTKLIQPRIRIKLLSFFIWADITLIIFSGLALTFVLFDYFKFQVSILQSVFFVPFVILFVITIVLKISRNITRGIPWHGYLKKVSIDELTKQQALLGEIEAITNRLERGEITDAKADIEVVAALNLQTADDMVTKSHNVDTQKREMADLREDLREMNDIILAHEKKNQLIKQTREKEDHLIKLTKDKLYNPVYRDQVKASFRSRKWLFRLISLLLVAMFFLVSANARAWGWEPYVNVVTIVLGFVLIYWYAGKRLWRCPACNFKLPFINKSDRSTTEHCPRCGAAFS
jgi:hypothetical protein